MKYFLVEVKKPFGIYPMKAQITMREKLAKGIFAENIKVIRELKESEMKKEFTTTVKYNITEPKKAKKADTPKTEENNDSKNVNTDTVDTNTSETPNDNATDENKATDDVQTDGSENTDAETPNTDASTDENTDTSTTPAGDDEDFEDKTTEELLEICNTTYKMNKPANTGRPNLLASLKEVTK